MHELKDKRSSGYDALSSGKKISPNNTSKESVMSCCKNIVTHVSRTLDLPADVLPTFYNSSILRFGQKPFAKRHTTTNRGISNYRPGTRNSVPMNIVTNTNLPRSWNVSCS